jgi:hypothetical protein
MVLLTILTNLLAAELDLKHLAKEYINIALIKLIVIFKLLHQVLSLRPALEPFLLALEDLEGDSVDDLFA